MVKNYDLILDIIDNRKIKSFNVNTNDLQSLKLSITVTQSGLPVNLTGTTPRIAIVKPDKTTIFQDCFITDALEGKCEVILNTQANIIPGLHIAEIMIYDGINTVTVAGRFSYVSVLGILDDSTVVSTNDWQAINQAIADAESILIDLRENGTGVDAQARSDIETIDAKLAEKVNKEDVRESTDTKPINVSEMDTETKQLFTGGAVAVVGQNSVGIENIKRKSVTESRTSFVKNRGNLFNKNDILLDGYFLSTGAWSTDTAFNSTNYIEVDYGSTYSTNVSNRIYSHVVFFDINKNFVSAIAAGTWSGTINVPNNSAIYYMTFAFYKSENLDTLMLVKGTALPATYIPYGFTLNDYFSLTKAQLDPLLEVKTGKNLFNYNTMVKVGKEIGTNAVERDGANSALMDYVSIDDTNKKLNVSGLNTYATGYNRLYSFYDANKNPLVSNISSQYILNSATEGTINIPTGAKYFRMNIYSNKTSGETFDYSKIQVEYGVVSTRLTPYQTKVATINGTSVLDQYLKTHNLKLLLFGDSITETATLSDDGATYTEGTRENWPLYTQSTLKFKELWNYAKSGASYKDRVIGTGTDTITSVRQRVTHQVQTAINNNRPGDVIIFAAGTNDGNTNMGSYATAMSKTTLADLDKTLLYEAMRWCFWTIQTYYPNALKFVSLPIQRGSYEPIESLNKAIREMGERYGFIVINMTAESQIVRDFETATSQRDLPDQLHPSKSGQIKMAKVFNRHILNNLNDGF